MRGLASTTAATWADADTAFDSGFPSKPPKGFDDQTLASARSFAVEWLRSTNTDAPLLKFGDDSRFQRTVNRLPTQSRRYVVASLDTKAKPRRDLLLLSKLATGTTVTGTIRAKGEWSVKTQVFDGNTNMSLIWTGTIAYPVQKEGKQSVITVGRTVTWNWINDPKGWPGIKWHGHFAGADPCAAVTSGVFAPAPNQESSVKTELANPTRTHTLDNMMEILKTCKK